MCFGKLLTQMNNLFGKNILVEFDQYVKVPIMYIHSFIYFDDIFRKLTSSSGLKHKILKTVKTVEKYYNSVHTSTHLHSLRHISELKNRERETHITKFPEGAVIKLYIYIYIYTSLFE